MRVYTQALKHTASVNILPVIGKQAIAKDEPSPLVPLQIVSPFKEPAFVGVRPRSRGRGGGGCRALPLLTHLRLRRAPERRRLRNRTEPGRGQRRQGHYATAAVVERTSTQTGRRVRSTARATTLDPVHMTPEEGREVMPRHFADADSCGFRTQSLTG